MAKKTCSYCGKPLDSYDMEHVFPSCLYPPSKQQSRVQRLTNLSCNECNNGWSDDEAHFRNVLMLAGEPNAPRREIWEGPVLRSFDEVDGIKRMDDLLHMMRPIDIDEGTRYMIFPADVSRVLRVVRKVVRGLCHYHQVLSPVFDHQVWVDTLRYQAPPGYLETMEYHHREPDIAEYWYQIFDEDEIHSAWIISFFNRVDFIGRVSRTGWGLIASENKA